MRILKRPCKLPHGTFAHIPMVQYLILWLPHLQRVWKVESLPYMAKCSSNNQSIYQPGQSGEWILRGEVRDHHPRLISHRLDPSPHRGGESQVLLHPRTQMQLILLQPCNIMQLQFQGMGSSSRSFQRKIWGLPAPKALKLGEDSPGGQILLFLEFDIFYRRISSKIYDPGILFLFEN